MKSGLVDTIYPVGSIYMSVSATSPSTLFGGTWVQLQNRFLLGAGSTYINGATGGEAAHLLTEAEMPSHSHRYNKNTIGAYETLFFKPIQAGDDGLTSTSPTRGVTGGYVDISNTGGGTAHNNMPPYLVVYMWKRTV
jgi:microcystin-dependent protein